MKTKPSLRERVGMKSSPETPARLKSGGRSSTDALRGLELENANLRGRVAALEGQLSTIHMMRAMPTALQPGFPFKAPCIAPWQPVNGWTILTPVKKDLLFANSGACAASLFYGPHTTVFNSPGCTAPISGRTFESLS